MKNKDVHFYSGNHSYDWKYSISACGLYFEGSFVNGEWLMDEQLSTDKGQVTCLMCGIKKPFCCDGGAE